MLAGLIYAISVLSSLDSLLTFMTISVFIVMTVISLVAFMTADDWWHDRRLKKLVLGRFKRFWTITLSLALLSISVPDDETMYAMVAAYGVTEAIELSTESEDLQRIGSKSLKVLEQFLDENLEKDEN